MQRFIMIRFGQALIAVLVVSVIVFSLSHLSGDPLTVLLPMGDVSPEDIDHIRAKWGLDKPIITQYGVFMNNALRGDFGDSYAFGGETAMGMVMSRFPATLQLAGSALLVAIIIGIPLGVITAAKKDSFIDYQGKALAFLGQAIPSFWLGIMLMWLFSVKLGWLPTSGKGGITHLIMPAFTLGLFQVAALLRLIRSSMLDTLDTEYVKEARIKGLPEWKVIWKHALRNALIAPLTYFAIIIGGLFTGAVIVETVFSWPGVGQLAVGAVQSRDFPVLQAVVIVGSAIYIAANFTVDVLYAYVDPRIRYA
jgi:peptide/nickel transport system permease protein